MFDIEMLLNNQHSLIEKQKTDSYRSLPESVQPNDFDDFIITAFSNFPVKETDTLILGSMSGPVIEVASGVLNVSRPTQILPRFASLHPTRKEAKTFAGHLAKEINANIAHIAEQNKAYSYYFYMWIPIYGIWQNHCSINCIMTHYARKVINHEA